MNAPVACFAAAVVTYAYSSGSLPMWSRVLLGILAGLSLLSTAPKLRERVSLQASRALHATIAATLAIVGLMHWSAMANHHFVMTYAALIFVVFDDEGDIQIENRALAASRLIAVLMGLAVLQKLLSPTYLDGSYFAHLIDTGVLGGPVLDACASCQQAAQYNFETIVAVLDEAPRAGQWISLAPVIGNDSAQILALARVFGTFVLLFELWLACVYAFAPKHWLAPYSLGAFAFGLALTRAEWVFGALVCALGVAACGRVQGMQGLSRFVLVAMVALFICLRLVSGDG